MNENDLSQPQTGRAKHERHGDVADGASQEAERFKATLDQNPETDTRQLNEGGRTHDSSEKSNPPGAAKGLPTPSLRGTWR